MFTGKAILAGVLGWPIAHSRSPQLHNHWISAHGIDGAYVPLAVAPERLEAAVRGLAALGFRGANVTVPHKEAVAALCDRVDRAARRAGAVNTLVFEPDGTLVGSNTDGIGFMANLAAGAPGWTPETGPAVVIGAGGSARSVVAALADAGSPRVVIVNRSRERAEKLAADLGGPVEVADWADRAAVLDGANLLVNTTTQGMGKEPALDLDLARLPPEAVVTDLVYTPLETPLLADARRRGHRAVDGLGMLIHQARPGFAAWFGVWPEVTQELRDLLVATL